MKWIASFPGNVEEGDDTRLRRHGAELLHHRASGGYPGRLLDQRRAHRSERRPGSPDLPERPSPESVGLIGTGLINREIARFLGAALPGIGCFRVFDLDPQRAALFARDVSSGSTEVRVAPDLEAILRNCSLLSFATTAIRPHIKDLSACLPGAVILHISLRDLSPQAILGCDNVVDDVDHVARAQTSIHLAEQFTGTRDFIRCTLAEILEGTAPPRLDQTRVTVFSPFGLGVLDVAVGQYVLDCARRAGRGTMLRSFLP